MDHPLARSLIATNPNILENGTICIPPNSCYCGGWLKSKGNPTERKIALAMQWATFALAISCLIWYAYQSWKATCGWEEVYVALIEMIKFSIEAFHEFDSPAMLWLSSGNAVVWLRYAEWLLTCPVILIHLSNLTGLKDDYSKRTMGLLVSDIGCIVWGATCAMATGWLRVIFFLIALAYGMYTYFHAAKVYIESYHTVPKGICRDLVRVLAWVYFCSWGMFPVLFVLGPEGFGHISMHGSAIAHALLDIVSKNLWGLLGNFLRVKIHEHILLYGDIRKKQKINIAGQEMEVETLMAEEDEDTVKMSTAKYASRDSFITMRDRLKDRGYEVRASLDGGDTQQGIETGGNGGGAAPALPPNAGKAAGTEMSKMGMGVGFGSGGGGGALALEPGRAILAVPDISMVDFFREQFAQLMVPYEVVPALGIDNTLQLVQQAATLGGCDFVLMHPEFLRDRGPTGLLPRLKMMGQRTAAFGWSSMGPMRDLIEGSGVDAWLEGPSFGSGISQTGLQQLVLRMQQAKRQAAAMGAGGGMMGGGGMGGGGMGGMGMGMGGGGMGGGGMGGGGMGGGGMGGGGMGMGMGGGGMGGGGMGGGGMGGGGMGGGGMGGTGAGSMMMGGGGGGGLTSMGSVNNMMMGASMGSGLVGMGSGTLQQQMSGGTGGGNMANMSSPQLQMQMQQPLPSPLVGSGASRIGTNPLFGSAPSPLNSQPGQLPPQSPMPLTAMGGGAAANPSEAEMLQQLMTEINRLKNELGE